MNWIICRVKNCESLFNGKRIAPHPKITLLKSPTGAIGGERICETSMDKGPKE